MSEVFLGGVFWGEHVRVIGVFGGDFGERVCVMGCRGMVNESFLVNVRGRAVRL